MPFTRKFIREKAKECGIESVPKELEDALVDEHLTARDAYAEEQVKPVQEKLDALDGKEPPHVDVKKSDEYKALQSEFDTYKADVQAKAENATKIDLLRSALKVAGANEKFIDRMIKGADLSAIAVKDGALEKSDEVVTGFKSGEWGDVFGEVKNEPANLGNPPNPKPNEPEDPFLQGFDG